MIPVVKPWVTPKKIYGTKVNQVWIDEAFDAVDALSDKLNDLKADALKEAALDELFGE